MIARLKLFGVSVAERVFLVSLQVSGLSVEKLHPVGGIGVRERKEKKGREGERWSTGGE
jgi:hypothetical protein